MPGKYEIVFRQLFQGFPLSPALPDRSSRGEGEDEAPPVPRAYVAYTADTSVIGLDEPCHPDIRLLTSATGPVPEGPRKLARGKTAPAVTAPGQPAAKVRALEGRWKPHPRERATLGRSV